MDALNAGESLAVDQKLTSNNGKYTLTMQGDGNMVLYGEGGSPVWASNTGGSGAVRASMQPDGNLVLYTEEHERRLRKDEPAEPVWASNTSGGNSKLVLQDDRNLVIYDGGGQPMWASGTGLEEAAAAPTGSSTSSPSMTPTASAERIHVVVSGDTLWAISQKFYGDGSKYMKIAKANRIANPDLIHPGQRLTIPD